VLKPICLILPLLLFAQIASAHIYKCVGKNGLDLYQNFPCEIDSLGLPSPVVPATAMVATSASNPAKSGSAASEPFPVRKAALFQGEPAIGMTTDDVRALWGEPISAVNSEIPEGLIEIWSYGPSRSVQFDRTGRVTEIRR
jgi:hypothetical protein